MEAFRKTANYPLIKYTGGQTRVVLYVLNPADLINLVGYAILIHISFFHGHFCGSDMPAEMRDEAMDICIIAVEKYQKEMEKCTQVWSLMKVRPTALFRMRSTAQEENVFMAR